MGQVVVANISHVLKE